MGYAEIVELLKLPPEERMRIAEALWASLAADPDAVPMGDTHRTLIDEAVAEHERSPDEVVSREQVLAEARRR